MGVYFGATEITNVDWIPGGKDITHVFFAANEVFTVWDEYDGTLPAQYSANGDYLVDYRVYGSNEGVGDRTENLFDVNNNIGITDNAYINQQGVLVSNAAYYVSGFMPVQPNSAYTWTFSIGTGSYHNAPTIALYNGTKTQIATVSHNSGVRTFGFTTPQNCEYIKASVYKNNKDTAMLTPGSTVPAEYVPYGRVIPMSVSDGTTSTTTPIYIGPDSLGEDEYVDYGEGKIYRKKQVHTDTVTIDGIVWDILGYDHDTVYKSDNTLAQHSVTIQAHDVLLDLQFDAKEALFAFDSGLSAGTYHFTVGARPGYSGDVNKTLQFTLAQALPAGGQLVTNNAYNVTMVGATISAFASGTTTTATETVTMSEGSDGTDIGTVTNGLSQDGVINSIQRANLGSNNWGKSAMRQYLNSSASAGSVWEPKTKWDRPPSWATTAAGFLNDMSAEFIANLGTTSKTTALNNVTDGGGAGTTLDKVFLISRSEVYAGDETTGGEGAAYPYYSEYSDLPSPGMGADTNRIKYRAGTAKYCWLRSPDTGGTYGVRSIYPSGTVSYSGAMNSSGVAPACCIPLDDIETNDWLREKFLKPVDPPVPLPALPTVDGTNIVDYAGQSAAVPSRFVAKYRKEGF